MLDPNRTSQSLLPTLDVALIKRQAQTSTRGRYELTDPPSLGPGHATLAAAVCAAELDAAEWGAVLVAAAGTAPIGSVAQLLHLDAAECEWPLSQCTLHVDLRVELDALESRGIQAMDSLPDGAFTMLLLATSDEVLTDEHVTAAEAACQAACANVTSLAPLCRVVVPDYVASAPIQLRAHLRVIS